MNPDVVAAAPVSLAAPLSLHLQPPAAALAYAATLNWETYANGDYQRTTIRKDVSLLVQANQAGYVLDFQAKNSEITQQEELEPLQEMALHLAALYARVVVQAAPTGEVRALLNHEELRQVWARLAPEIQAATTADDAITGTILAFVDGQLQAPANVLRSLQLDYLYQTLAPDLYAQPLAGPRAPTRERRFAGFFDGVPLCFAEQVVVLPATPAAPLALRLHGPLDAQKTDLAAVKSAIAAALQLAPAAGPLPADVPEPHFCYEATYVLDVLTALPLRAELQVYARAGQLYNKEYTLIINRL